MLNAHNLCVFEGRIIKDPEYTSVQTSNGQMEKATFTIAVDRNLSTQQRQAAKNGDQSVVTSDFVRCSITGNAVNTFKQYCPKGKAITVACTYATFSFTDRNSGQTQYGHIFNVESFSFTVADAKNMNQADQNQGNNNNYGNNNYNNGNYGNGNGNYNNNYGNNNGNYGSNNYGNNGGGNYNNNDNGNFQMFDSSNSASPF